MECTYTASYKHVVSTDFMTCRGIDWLQVLESFVAQISSTIGQSLQLRTTSDNASSDLGSKEVEELRNTIESLEIEVRRCSRRLRSFRLTNCNVLQRTDLKSELVSQRAEIETLKSLSTSAPTRNGKEVCHLQEGWIARVCLTIGLDSWTELSRSCPTVDFKGETSRTVASWSWPFESESAIGDAGCCRLLF